MTPADRSPAATQSERARQDLEETFVLLDNNSGQGAPSLLFSEPETIVAAASPAEVPPALAALEAGLKQGLYAAGFFAYELGYVLEPKLAPLLPGDRTVPLLWFGLYRSPV